MYLERLVDAAHTRLEDGYYRRRPGALLQTDPPSLAHALHAPDAPAVVAEVKPARPDGARWNAQPGPQARAYAAGGADAISILTDPDHFDGDLEHLQHARSTGLPLLMKDFLIDEEQIHAARAWGASAVLIIARLSQEGHTEHTVHELVHAAHETGLEALVEVDTREQYETARKAGADAIGINQRDLDTLDHDPERTRRVLDDARVDRPVLHLSGIQDASDVQRALDAGAHGVLVGSAAMSADDPAAFVASLKEDPA